MSGVLTDGVQYEHCSHCEQMVDINTLEYGPSFRWPEHEAVDLCPRCAAGPATLIPLSLHKNCTQAYEIGKFWAAISLNERNRALASVHYLHATGRMDDDKMRSHLANMDKLMAIEAVIRQCRTARHEDGDLTLWSQLRGERATHEDRR